MAAPDSAVQLALPMMVIILGSRCFRIFARAKQALFWWNMEDIPTIRGDNASILSARRLRKSGMNSAAAAE